MADVLALVLQHNEADVALAIDEALKTEMPSKQHVVNCLNRQAAPVPAEPLIAPTTLKLNTEPEANTRRYDQLRGPYYAH
jgi:hypothetical protein